MLFLPASAATQRPRAAASSAPHEPHEEIARCALATPSRSAATACPAAGTGTLPACVAPRQTKSAFLSPIRSVFSVARQTLAATRPGCLGTPEDVRLRPKIREIVKGAGRHYNRSATSS